MAKSSYKDNIKNDTRVVRGDADDFYYKLRMVKSGYVIEYNFHELEHYKCNLSLHYVKERYWIINDVSKKIYHAVKNGMSVHTAENYFLSIRRYIKFCDSSDVEPFSKQGYLSFCGVNGELWRQVTLANEPKPYLFMYEDGEGLGLTEKSAALIKRHVNLVLEMGDQPVFEWNRNIPFFANVSNNSAIAYQPHEYGVALKRLQLFFFSVAAQLISFAKDNPGTPPPKKLKVLIDTLSNKVPLEIELNGKFTNRVLGRFCNCLPFNQCMVAAYFILAHYSAFNDNTIRDIRRPIDFITSGKSGKTMRHVTLRGWKGRSNKVVQTLLTDNTDYSIIPESIGNKPGALYASVDKSNGAAFIKVLSELSIAYNPHPNGRLIYQLDKSGNIVQFKDKSLSILSELLGLLSETRYGAVNCIIDAYYLVRDYSVLPEVKKIKGELGDIIVSKKNTICIGYERDVAISLYSQAAFQCFTDESLKFSILPLSITEPDIDGMITVSFGYKNSACQNSFKAPEKFREFFQDVADWAESRTLPNQSLPIESKDGDVTNPPYLFPLGDKGHTNQNYPINIFTKDSISRLGIGSGQFFLALLSSRFRVTTSDKEHASIDSGYNARILLQHSLEQHMRYYKNGNPDENMRITAQAIEVFEHIIHGVDEEEAKAMVCETWKIPVLDHDNYVFLRKPSNPNGVLCDGKPQLDGSTKEYLLSLKQSGKLGLTSEGLNINCYQYDLCTKCKNAKFVDDEHSVYKLLSFIEALLDAVDQYPASASCLENKAKEFEMMMYQHIPIITINAAKKRLVKEGIYPLFDNGNHTEFLYLYGVE